MICFIGFPILSFAFTFKLPIISHMIVEYFLFTRSIASLVFSFQAISRMFINANLSKSSK